MAEKHFNEQQQFTKSYLIPYFEKYLPGFPRMNILEIGCAEGGFLNVMHGMDVNAIGIELEEERVKIAKRRNPDLNIILGDITDEKIVDAAGGTFSLIVMRDVIEHIGNRRAVFTNIGKLLEDGGCLYITFPPRFSAFAGHQQNYHSLLKFFPYLHLLPEIIIRLLGKIFNEHSQITRLVALNYKIGLSICKFEKYYREYGFTPLRKDLFLFRPVYEIRFNIKSRRFPDIPLVREVFALGCEYLLQKHAKSARRSE